MTTLTGLGLDYPDIREIAFAVRIEQRCSRQHAYRVARAVLELLEGMDREDEREAEREKKRAGRRVTFCDSIYRPGWD